MGGKKSLSKKTLGPGGGEWREERGERVFACRLPAPLVKNVENRKSESWKLKTARHKVIGNKTGSVSVVVVVAVLSDMVNYTERVALAGAFFFALQLWEGYRGKRSYDLFMAEREAGLGGNAKVEWTGAISSHRQAVGTMGAILSVDNFSDANLEVSGGVKR